MSFVKHLIFDFWSIFFKSRLWTYLDHLELSSTCSQSGRRWYVLTCYFLFPPHEQSSCILSLWSALPGYLLEQRVPCYDPWFCSIISAVSLFLIMSKPSCLIILCSVFFLVTPLHWGYHVMISDILFVVSFHGPQFSPKMLKPLIPFSWSFSFSSEMSKALIPLLKHNAIHVLFG